jgi:hypothetical protein
MTKPTCPLTYSENFASEPCCEAECAWWIKDDTGEGGLCAIVAAAAGALKFLEDKR